MRKYCASLVLTFDQFEAEDNKAADALLDDYIDKLNALCEDINSKLIYHSADAYVQHVTF